MLSAGARRHEQGEVGLQGLGICLKGTEISLGKFVSEYFTPLTLGLQTGVVSTEDTDEIWDASKEEAMEKTKGRETRRARADSPMVDETEVEKSFWLSRPIELNCFNSHL